MFFGAARRRKKFDAAMGRARSFFTPPLGERACGLARGFAEEAYGLARGLLPDTGPLCESAALLSRLLVRLSAWQEAQDLLTEASARLDQTAGPGSPDAVRIAVQLARLLRQRERFGAAQAVLEPRVEALAPDHPGLLEVELERILLGSATGRHEDALSLARALFQRTRERQAEDPSGAILAAQALSNALSAASQSAGEALALARAFMLPPASGAAGGSALLRGALTLTRALIGSGDLASAASLAERVLKREVSTSGGPLPLFNPDEMSLCSLRAEALAAMGLQKEAVTLYRETIQRTLALDGSASPSLIPLFEGLAAVLRDADPRDAERQQRRAEELRERITGQRPERPAHRPTSNLTTRIWPHRTLSGVFGLARIEPARVEEMIALVARGASDVGPFEVLSSPEVGGTALVLEGGEDPWQPPRALRIRAFHRELSRLVDLANVALRSRGQEAALVELVPWWAVRDDVYLHGRDWPPALQESSRRRLLPTLPGWTGRAGDWRWLGTGLRREEGKGRVTSVSPTVALQFVEGKGITFEGAAPADALDEWFDAFARATRLFEPGQYSPLRPAPNASSLRPSG